MESDVRVSTAQALSQSFQQTGPGLLFKRPFVDQRDQLVIQQAKDCLANSCSDSLSARASDWLPVMGCICSSASR